MKKVSTTARNIWDRTHAAHLLIWEINSIFIDAISLVSQEAC